MLASSWIVGCSLLTLGWAPSVANLFGFDPKGNATIVVAVFSIYGVDIAINVLQASSRGLIVDTLPRVDQQTGAAWDARVSTHYPGMLPCNFAIWLSLSYAGPP